MESHKEILAIIRGESSEREKALFYNKLNEDNELRELFYELKNTWIKAGLLNVSKDAAPKADFDQIWQRINKDSWKNRFRKWGQYAAVILIIVMAGVIGARMTSQRFGQQNDQIYRFSTGQMSVAEIELPDGSKVSLNSNTKITYVKNESNNERLVTLSGEAFFDVIHDEQSPFVLDFNQLQIIDLGTKFSVKAYDENETIETSLFEGALDILVNNKHQVSVMPGESYVYHTNSQEVKRVRRLNSNPTAWRKNRFEYHNEKLEIILIDLAQWYNFDVEWQNEEIKHKQFLLNIDKTQNAENILELLALGSEMKYEIVKKNNKINKVIIK
ncbi:MAG: FecR family protein [Carboxylicivirga sp.]|jgi:ferric-dicitrate binding protein FerR (iron transport regulator)|nr:FecR family protein [Carboxylicivirga sp.]